MSSNVKVIKRSALTGEIVAIYPSVEVAAMAEGRKPNTIRSWCNGNKKAVNFKFEYDKKPAQGGCEFSLCWFCDNAYGGCSWSREFKPVPGWTATRRDMTTSHSVGGKNRQVKTESYIVHKCPEHVPDPPLEERLKRLRER